MFALHAHSVIGGVGARFWYIRRPGGDGRRIPQVVVRGDRLPLVVNRNLWAIVLGLFALHNPGTCYPTRSSSSILISFCARQGVFFLVTGVGVRIRYRWYWRRGEWWRRLFVLMVGRLCYTTHVQVTPSSSNPIRPR